MKVKFIQLFKHSVIATLLVCVTVSTSLNSCVTSGGIVYQSYTPPAWAPPYDDVSTIHYYYFPDYNMYYDAWDSQFWFSDNGVWVSSYEVPAIFGNIDLYSSYVVLINKKYSTPWNDNDYYVRNYPTHCYINYKDIVVSNRIVKNIAPNHELVPRAFNENNNRVTFMQRPIQNNPPQRENPMPNNSQARVNEPQTRMNEPNKPMQASPVVNAPQQYHHVSHEVPIKTIRPFMPTESKNLNYGNGFKKH